MQSSERNGGFWFMGAAGISGMLLRRWAPPQWGWSSWSRLEGQSLLDSCSTATVPPASKSASYQIRWRFCPPRRPVQAFGGTGRWCGAGWASLPPLVLPGSERSVRSAERARCSPTPVAVCVTERLWFPIVLRLFNLLQTEMYHTLPALSMQSVEIQVCVAYISNNSKRASRMQATGVFMNTLNFSSKQTHLVLQPSWSMSRRRTKKRRITRRRRKWKQTMASRTTTVLWWPQVHGSIDSPFLLSLNPSQLANWPSAEASTEGKGFLL